MNERTCVFGCDEVENEQHVIVDCPNYNDLRTKVLQAARAHSDNFDNLSSADKLAIIMCLPETTTVAKLCNNILSRRRCLLYD